MVKTSILAVVLAIVCIALGGLSSTFGSPDEWFRALRKPAWMPPNVAFPIAWTILYALMGVAFALVLSKGWTAGGVKRATALFIAQLVVNLSWSPVFFGLHHIGAALVIILVLWFLIGWTVAAFWSVRDVAGVLLMPYWLWVTFAITLNAGIWELNA